MLLFLFFLFKSSLNAEEVTLHMGNMDLGSDGKRILLQKGIYRVFEIDGEDLSGNLKLNDTNVKLDKMTGKRSGNFVIVDVNRYNRRLINVGIRDNCYKIFFINHCLTLLAEKSILQLEECKINPYQCVDIKRIEDNPMKPRSDTVYNNHRAGNTVKDDVLREEFGNSREKINISNKSDSRDRITDKSIKPPIGRKRLNSSSKDIQQSDRSLEKEQGARVGNSEKAGRDDSFNHQDDMETSQSNRKDPHLSTDENSIFPKDYDLSLIQPSIDTSFHEVIAPFTDIVLNQKRYIPNCFYGYQGLSQFLNDPLPNLRKMRNKYCVDMIYDISH